MRFLLTDLQTGLKPGLDPHSYQGHQEMSFPMKKREEASTKGIQKGECTDEKDFYDKKTHLQ